MSILTAGVPGVAVCLRASGGGERSCRKCSPARARGTGAGSEKMGPRSIRREAEIIMRRRIGAPSSYPDTGMTSCRESKEVQGPEPAGPREISRCWFGVRDTNRELAKGINLGYESESPPWFAGPTATANRWAWRGARHETQDTKHRIVISMLGLSIESPASNDAI